jgi:hypothetical protein
MERRVSESVARKGAGEVESWGVIERVGIGVFNGVGVSAESIVGG